MLKVKFISDLCCFQSQRKNVQLRAKVRVSQGQGQTVEEEVEVEEVMAVDVKRLTTSQDY